MKLIDWVLDCLFPPKCPFCRKVVETAGICSVCAASAPWAEGEAGVRTGPEGFLCAAPLLYQGQVRQALLRLKFQGASYLARPLGELIAQCAAERFSGEFDTVTWVPTGPKRVKKRGYDQARLLAEAACRAWDTTPERLLVKPADNPAQSSLKSTAQRRSNVVGKYALAPQAQVAGRRILLIDDICTTGSTLGECVRVLRAGGAKAVMCAAVALTALEADGQPGLEPEALESQRP